MDYRLPPDSVRFEGFKNSIANTEERTGKEIFLVPSDQYEDYLYEVGRDENKFL
jgi:hypothetical protein